MDCVYLDSLNARPLLDEARAAVLRAMDLGPGHPRSSNRSGRETREFLDRTAEELAELFGGSEAVLFDSGGTANAAAVLAAGRIARKAGRGHVVVSPLERTSVVSALRILRAEGSVLTAAAADRGGRLIPSSLAEAVGRDTGLVVCSLACGVSGVVQPFGEIAEISRSAGAWLHADACWAAGNVTLDISSIGVDSIAVSSPEAGGPPGGAALILSRSGRWPSAVAPEFPVSTDSLGAAGLAAAMKTAVREQCSWTKTVNALRDRLLKGLDSRGVSYSIIGDRQDGLLPGAALLELKRHVARLHAEMEMANIVIPSHNSFERLSFLERAGFDMTCPERYVGFCIDPRNTAADVDHFVRTLSRLCGGKGD